MKRVLTITSALFLCFVLAIVVYARVNPDPVNDGTKKIYTVAKGDTMAKIASKHNLTLSQLQALNPQIKNISRIYVGDKLVVGVVTAKASPTPVPTKPTATPAAATPKSSPTPTPIPKIGANVKVAALKGPTAMGMLKIMSDNEAGTAANNYSFEIDGTADEVVAKLVKGELDIAAVPCNLASVLYNKTNGGIKVMAVNTLGVLYVLDTTGSVKNIADLKGKTIYTVGKGTTPEFALNYVLKQNGLTPGKDVKVEFKSEATELAALISAGKADLCMLPEPYVTTVLSKNANLKVAFSLTEEWNNVQPEFKLLTGTVIVRNAFLESNKPAVDAFLAEYKLSAEYVNKNVSEAAKLCAKYEIAPEAVAKIAMPRCNIVFIEGDKMIKDVSGYLSVLFEADAKSVGGKLPDEKFYYKK